MDSTTTQTQNGICHCENFQEKVEFVANVIRQVTEDYKAEEVFISFNGGKDCTVLLDMYMKNTRHVEKPRVIYFQPENPFSETDEFMVTCEKTYGIRIESIRNKSKKDGLAEICEKSPELKVVVMGCRRTDPYCDKLETFQLTDEGWPKILRVNPLLDWNYHEIWRYIREKKTEYCSLYDQGYTSIGDRKNTYPNEHLRIANDGYKPAWELQDGDQERSGRS